jgi:2-acylglycerol O-acyltransferase 2
MGARQWAMKHLRVALPLFWGRWGTPVPYPVTLTMVVGAPMPVTRVEPPSAITNEQVEEVHAAFVVALTALFDKHKASCGYKDAVLEIF